MKHGVYDGSAKRINVMACIILTVFQFFFQGIKIHNVSCGIGHTLFIAKNDLDEEKKNLLKMNVFKA